MKKADIWFFFIVDKVSNPFSLQGNLFSIDKSLMASLNWMKRIVSSLVRRFDSKSTSKMLGFNLEDIWWIQVTAYSSFSKDFMNFLANFASCFSVSTIETLVSWIKVFPLVIISILSYFFSLIDSIKEPGRISGTIILLSFFNAISIS